MSFAFFVESTGGSVTSLVSPDTLRFHRLAKDVRHLFLLSSKHFLSVHVPLHDESCTVRYSIFFSQRDVAGMIRSGSSVHSSKSEGIFVFPIGKNSPCITIEEMVWPVKVVGTVAKTRKQMTCAASRQILNCGILKRFLRTLGNEPHTHADLVQGDRHAVARPHDANSVEASSQNNPASASAYPFDLSV